MDQVQVLKDKGNAALAANNFGEAIECYTEAIALDGKNHVLFSNRSAAFFQSEKYEEALKDAEKTIELKPDWVKGYFRKGCALASLGEYSQAGSAFQQAMNIDPNNAEIKEAISNLITINLSDCRKDPRMLKLMRDLNIDVFGAGEMMDVDPQPQSPLHRSDANGGNPPPPTGSTDDSKMPLGREEAMKEKMLGNEAYKNKDFETALKHYFKAVELNPTEITYYNNIAAVYFEQKEFKKCIEQCEKGIEIGRENRADFKLIAKAFTRIGNAYKKLNDLYNAKIYYEKSMSEHRTPEIRTMLSDVEKVIKEQERKAYIDPVKGEEEKEKGNELFKKGDYAGAVKHYTEAIKRNPDEAKYYSNRAACYTKLAAFDLGLKDCEMCLKLDPKFFKGWVRKGKILQGMQQHGKALVAYQKALDLDPHNSEALEGYRTCSVAVHSNPEEVRKRAMADPEVQAILQDPAMRLILEQMQNDPKALQDHLRNPDIAAKIQKLLESGLIAIH